MKVNRNYIFTIITACLCFASANLLAQKSTGTSDERVNLNVYIPNAITPNSDGLNDVFKPIVSGGEIDTYDLAIFDRKGRQIFHANTPDKVWNGSIDGSNYAAAPNLYIYYLKIKAVASLETKTFTGHIVTVR